MKEIKDYQPGAADLAHVIKDRDDWTLALVKELNHPPEVVWKALTDPAQLRKWAPFDSDKNLDDLGPVNLTAVGTTYVSETRVTRAEAPYFLEYAWGGNETRWQLVPTENGTRLMLWAKIPRKFIAMGAAGWHVCLDVLDLVLNGAQIDRIVGEDALRFEGWQRLHAEYATQFGVEIPNWKSSPQ